MKNHVWVYNQDSIVINSEIEKHYGGFLRLTALGFIVIYKGEETRVIVVRSSFELTKDFIRKTTGFVIDRLVFMNWCQTEELLYLIERTRGAVNPTYFIGCNDWWPDYIKETTKNWLIEE